MRLQLPDDTNTVRLYSEEEMGDDYEPPGLEVQTDHERGGMKYVRVKKRVGEKMMQGKARGRFKEAVDEAPGGGDTPADERSTTAESETTPEPEPDTDSGSEPEPSDPATESADTET